MCDYNVSTTVSPYIVHHLLHMCIQWPRCKASASFFPCKILIARGRTKWLSASSGPFGSTYKYNKNANATSTVQSLWLPSKILHLHNVCGFPCHHRGRHGRHEEFMLRLLILNSSPSSWLLCYHKKIDGSSSPHPPWQEKTHPVQRLEGMRFWLHPKEKLKTFTMMDYQNGPHYDDRLFHLCII